MGEVADLLSNEASVATLDRVALDIARIEYPDLDPEPWIQRLDMLAFEISQEAGDSATALDFIRAANEHLFRKLGFHGNQQNYYDVRNSCLNDVLESRTGIPITLSLIYIEMARRLNRPVHGIGLPSHFIVQYDDGQFSTYIDPFGKGALLTRSECSALVRQRTGAPPPQTAFLPCGRRQIAQRMLQNLKGVFVRIGAFEKALQVFDLLLCSPRFAPEEHKQRAVILLELHRYREALSGFKAYLDAAPAANDRAEVVKQVEIIHRYLAALN